MRHATVNLHLHGSLDSGAPQERNYQHMLIIERKKNSEVLTCFTPSFIKANIQLNKHMAQKILQRSFIQIRCGANQSLSD